MEGGVGSWILIKSDEQHTKELKRKRNYRLGISSRETPANLHKVRESNSCRKCASKQ